MFGSCAFLLDDVLKPGEVDEDESAEELLLQLLVDDKAVPCSLWNRFAFVVGVMLVTDDVDR